MDPEGSTNYSAGGVMSHAVVDGISGPIQITTPFTLGTRVDWHGAKGYVNRVSSDPHTLMIDFPIGVKFDSGHEYHFTADGRHLLSQTEPSLKLAAGEPCKKVVPKWQWLRNVRGDWSVTLARYSEEEFKKNWPGEIGTAKKIEESLILEGVQ